MTPAVQDLLLNLGVIKKTINVTMEKSAQKGSDFPHTII
jgi:hypothetical protein